jgi:hypothetical protein
MIEQDKCKNLQCKEIKCETINKMKLLIAKLNYKHKFIKIKT